MNIVAVDGKYSGPIILPTITTAIIGLSDTNKHKTIPIVGLSSKKNLVETEKNVLFVKSRIYQREFHT